MKREYPALVKRVIDGDTIVVTIDLGFSIFHDMPLRMYGINAPETNSTNPEERVNGVLAKKWLTDKIMDKAVRVQSVKPNDKYGRYLAEVWLDDDAVKSVNQMMIDEKLAKPWDGRGEKPV